MAVLSRASLIDREDIRPLDPNVHSVQNTLPTYTVNTIKFDLNELNEIVVCGWQFFVDCGFWAGMVEDLHLETEYFWLFVSGGRILFSLAIGLGLELLPQKTLFLLSNTHQWTLVIKYLQRSLPLPSHRQRLSLYLFSVLVLFELWLCWLDGQFSLVCISNRVTLKAITQKLPEKDSNTRQNCRSRRRRQFGKYSKLSQAISA